MPLGANVASPAAVTRICRWFALVILLTVSSSTGATHGAQRLVRWHGDYYQHKWETGVPGGTPKAQLENRWFRGGPPKGALHSTLHVDLDGDGSSDDTRVFFDYSTTEALNPKGVPAKPGGVYYHETMPSSEFYGGLSVNFYNYQTNRIQQAYIENDGAGGDPADVGYPSPYMGPEYQAFRDKIQSLRNKKDGRFKKTHIGPQEDFAVNIYRPDNPLPVAGESAADNLLTFAAAFLWKKADFLTGGASQRVSLSADSRFSFESTRWWENVGQARWLIQDGSGQTYISNFNVPGKQDNWGFTNVFADPLNSLWAAYNPAIDDVNFKQTAPGVVWLNPTSAGLFQDIQAFGLYLENDTPSNKLTRFSLDEIQFWATISSSLQTLRVQAVAEPTSCATFAVAAIGMIGAAVYRRRRPPRQGS